MKSVVFQTSSGSPNSAAWHAWRGAGVGASDAPVIAAGAGLIEPAEWMSSVHKLWLIKTGQSEGPTVNAAMRRGTKWESAARIAVEKATGIVIAPVFGEMDENPFVRASFDGMDFLQTSLVEIKIPSQKVHQMAKNGIIVPYYVPQLVHQGMTAWGPPGKSWDNKLAIFASYVPETQDLALVHKTGRELYQEFDVDQLYLSEQEFWRSVQSRMALCGDEFLALAAQYKRVDEAYQVADQEREKVRMQIVDMLGERDLLEGGGVRALRSERAGSVDWEKVVKKLATDFTIPEETIVKLKESIRKKGSSSITITVEKPKSAEPKKVKATAAKEAEVANATPTLH